MMTTKYNKIVIFICMLTLLPVVSWAQTGINTNSPKSTLDVSAVNTSSHIAGLIAPRLTLAELTAKGNSLYGADQKAAIIYITNTAGGGNTGQRANITSPGYYYFDGAVWLKFGYQENTWVTGNIKDSFKTTDHNGWYLLDGRSISGLPTKAKATAISLGFATNLPDARDRVLKTKDGTEVLGSTGGTNTVSLSLANLPALTLTGTYSGTSTSDGAHTHSLNTTSSNTSHTHTFSTTSSNNSHAHTLSLTSTNNTHTHVFSATSSINGAHTHTYEMPTRANSSFLGTLNSFYDMTKSATTATTSSGAHTHSFSGTSASGGAAHTHTVTGTAASGGAAHTHTFSGTSASGGAAHTHTVAGTAASGGAAHTHTVTGTASVALGTAQALDKKAAYLVVNTFVYLGE